jgi:hypothetical protein
MAEVRRIGAPALRGTRRAAGLNILTGDTFGLEYARRLVPMVTAF